jgi:hypothetical protein
MRTICIYRGVEVLQDSFGVYRPKCSPDVGRLILESLYKWIDLNWFISHDFPYILDAKKYEDKPFITANIIHHHFLKYRAN